MLRSRWTLMFALTPWLATPALAARSGPQPAKPRIPASALPSLQSLHVLPAAPELRGPGAQQQLLVLGEFSDGSERELTHYASFTAPTPRIAAVDASGRVRARGDGEGRVRVDVGGTRAWVKVQVSQSTGTGAVSFRDDVIPALTRAGCNQGACHGAMAGKGGFRLSLLGFDPQADYVTIVREAKRRRVALSDPAHSLLLE